MRRKLRVACIQINAGKDWQENLNRVDHYCRVAIQARAELIAFPENFYWRGSSHDLFYLSRHVTPRVIQQFKEFASRHHVAILLGSVPEVSNEKGHYYNTSILISEKAKIVAQYRKIHLFDISLRGKLKTQESRYVARGRRIVTGKTWGIPAGLTICYDLRFPELFRRLTDLGSRIIFVPSNFTETTGKVHWEVLLKARAIENQVFIIAPAQVGFHPESGIKSFGTSLVVDPWGKVVKRGSKTEEEVIVSDLDLGFQEQIRHDFPVLKHRFLKG